MKVECSTVKLYANIHGQSQMFRCPKQDHLPLLKVTWYVKNVPHYVLLGHLELRWLASDIPRLTKAVRLFD